jgi:hypothetical protein
VAEYFEKGYVAQTGPLLHDDHDHHGDGRGGDALLVPPSFQSHRA